MNSSLYQIILQENVRPSICELKLKRSWDIQEDNDPKYKIKSTWKWLKSNKFDILEWLSQSPDLIAIEMLWQELKLAVPAWKPTNVAEFCMGERANIPPHHCGGILAHSCMQNWFNSATVVGFHAWTARFKSCCNISIGIRSGLWLGHSKTSNLLLFSHFHVDLIVCFGSLFYCVTQLHFSFSSQTDGLTFSCRIPIQSRIHGSFY